MARRVDTPEAAQRRQALSGLLRDARIQAKRTQAQVAEHFGMGQTDVSDMETGECKRIPILVLRQLAVFYGWTFVDFLAELEARLNGKKPMVPLHKYRKKRPDRQLIIS